MDIPAEQSKASVKTASKFVAAVQLRGSRAEILFYLTFFATVVHAGFILWGLVTMTSEGSRLFALTKPNDIYASVTISNIYLALLASYAGYKEFKRWTGSDDAAVPEPEANAFRRGEAIIAFWVLLTIVSASLEALHVTARMPHELVRTAMQVLAVMLGSYGSRTIKNRKQKTKGRESENCYAVPGFDSESGAPSIEIRKQKVLEYLQSNPYVDNELCRSITGMDRFQAHRFLEALESDGILAGDGKGKGRIYKLADKLS